MILDLRAWKLACICRRSPGGRGSCAGRSWRCTVQAVDLAQVAERQRIVAADISHFPFVGWLPDLRQEAPPTVQLDLCSAMCML